MRSVPLATVIGDLAGQRLAMREQLALLPGTGLRQEPLQLPGTTLRFVQASADQQRPGEQDQQARRAGLEISR
ncbi:hypothetical protein D9M71_831520 [compost metagenome]